MTEECPKHCADDREGIHELLKEMKDDRRRRWSVFLATLVTVLGGGFIMLYNGMAANSREIVKSQKEVMVEMKSLSQEVESLKIIVTRIDERTKTTNTKLEQHRRANGG